MDNLIKKALEIGNISKAMRLAKDFISQEYKQEWDKVKRDEYELIFPTYRDMTNDEYLDTDTLKDGTYPLFDSLEIKPQVEIDYIDIETVTDEDGNIFDREIRTPSNYLKYDEWINETRVVSEAVEATYDADGIELTPYIAEVVELIRPYIPITITDELILNKLSTFSEYKAYKGRQKLNDINNITVTTTTGKVLYADPISRTDIADVIKCMEMNNIAEYQWKTVNGTMIVTLNEFKEALLLGLQKKGEIIGV